MSNAKLKRWVYTALMTAITAVLTMVVQVPSPMQGYVNLGDCGVLLSAWILGPAYGSVAAGVGSALADILLSYAHYAPGTLVIKAVMALVAGLLVSSRAKRVLGGVLAECIMVLGYFGYASLLLGKGLAAAASIPGNIAQGVMGLAAALVLFTVLKRSGVVDKL